MLMIQITALDIFFLVSITASEITNNEISEEKEICLQIFFVLLLILCITWVFLFKWMLHMAEDERRTAKTQKRLFKAHKIDNGASKTVCLDLKVDIPLN